MDCIIAAGGLPTPDDPVYPYTDGQPKALIDMHGRTMLERVVDALQEAKHIDDIVVVGLGSDMGQTFKHPVHHLPDHGSLVKNFIAGARYWMQEKPDSQTYLVATADDPLISGEMIDQYIEMCRPHDAGVYYIMVTKEAMEKRFPGSNRTYVKLKGLEIAGGDFGIVNRQLIEKEEVLEMVANARKHAWRIARIAGFTVLLKLLFRQLSTHDIETTAERIIGLPARIILNPPAELAMDADKPHQIDMVRAELAKTLTDEQ